MSELVYNSIDFSFVKHFFLVFQFSLEKRKCGMGLVTAKLEDTAAHVVALSILLLNLRKIQYAFLQFLDWLLGFLQPCEKLRVVQ